jgi:hypothetical protein
VSHLPVVEPPGRASTVGMPPVKSVAVVQMGTKTCVKSALLELRATGSTPNPRAEAEI